MFQLKRTEIMVNGMLEQLSYIYILLSLYIQIQYSIFHHLAACNFHSSTFKFVNISKLL